jgi:hypothetical protein
MSKFSRFVLIAALSVFAAATAAPVPTILGVSKAWSAYQADTPNGKTCYALAKPKSTEPRKTVRDPVYLMLSDWPDRKVKGEFEIIPGYAYKDSGSATAAVGSDKVDLFTRNENGTGQAWVKDPADEERLREAMRKGATLVVNGVSERGTHTRDVYSLAGISTMLDKVHTACGL